MALGKQIKLYRKEAGFTLENLSERSGVDVGTISALENRDSKRSQFIPAIAAAFGLTVEQFADESTVYPLTIDGVKTRAYNTASSVTGAPVPIKAAQRTPHYGNSKWPFETPLAQVLALSERDLGRIDGFMQAIVASAMTPRKSAG